MFYTQCPHYKICTPRVHIFFFFPLFPFFPRTLFPFLTLYPFSFPFSSLVPFFPFSHSTPVPFVPLALAPLSVCSLSPTVRPFSRPLSSALVRPLAVCPFPLPPCFPLFPLLTQTKRAKYDSNRQPLTKTDKKRRINKKRGKGEKKPFTMR